MNNSNETLRFSRTYREATGTDYYDSTKESWDKAIALLVGAIFCFLSGFLLGLSA